jgi:hypothetical protein
MLDVFVLWPLFFLTAWWAWRIHNKGTAESWGLTISREKQPMFFPMMVSGYVFGACCLLVMAIVATIRLALL